jgi:transposase InsO family protein
MNTKEVKQWQEESALDRYRMIAPLLDETLDEAKRLALRKQLAEQNDISVRSLYRYEKAYRENQFTGLKPRSREMRRGSGLPDNFEELVAEAVLLKREVPTRSVAQIILILEMEGRVEPGILKRSTLQRHLYKAGFGKKQMKKYADAKTASTKRFCKEHRMQLAQADIKYGPYLPIGSGGKKIQTYLVAIIDDHSKVILASRFYDNQEKAVVEDVYRMALLKFGAFSATYVDNGKQFISNQLVKALTKLGIRHMRAKPYAANSKGKIEVYNRFVNGFIAEAKAQKVKTLEELNHFWQVWVEEYYHQKPHDGIK